jgi:hypothetical protein
MQFYPVSCYFLFLSLSPFFFYYPLFHFIRIGPNTLPRILFSHTLNFLFPSLSVRDQVLGPYKTTGRTVILYILIFTCLGSNTKTNSSEMNDSKYPQNLNCSSSFAKSFCLYTVISKYNRTPLLHSSNLHFSVMYNIFSGPFNFPKFIMCCKLFPTIYTIFVQSLLSIKVGLHCIQTLP